MRGRAYVVLAALFLPAPATAAPLGRSFCVGVVKTGEPVTALQIKETALALRQGIKNSGASVLDETATAELADLADPVTGACDETCEKNMRARLAGRAQLALARLDTTRSHFALRVTDGSIEVSAVGMLAQLPSAATRLGNQIASSGEGKLVLDGPAGAEWFVNGRSVAPARGGIRIAPGRHLVRIGDGKGARRMAMVDVIAGEVATATFPTDGPPSPAKAGKPVVKPSLVGRPAARPSIWSAHGGMTIISRTHRLSGADGGGFRAAFAGIGPRVVARLRLDRAIADIEAAWISYGFSTADFDLGEGRSASVTGGSAVHARLAGGWRFGGEDSFSITPAAALRHESQASEDPKCPPAAPGCADGEPLGLLPSYTRTSADLLVRGMLPVHKKLALDAEVGVSAIAVWTESPSGTTGENARSDLAPSWRLGADAMLGRWTARADYAGEMRSVRFKGAGPTLVEPDIRDGRIQQSSHAISLSVGRRF